MDAPRERAMVVDDSWYMRVLIRDILETGNIEMIGVEGAEDALEALRAERPDVILVDMVLPSRDGLSLMRELATVAPGVPVIVVSGCTDYATRRRALQAGAAAFVDKPFGPADLLAAVEGALELSRDRARQLLIA